MIVYEIVAIVEASLAAEYERYLAEQHIPDLMATGCFVSTQLSRTDDTFQIRYAAADRESLERYFNQHAERLRADALKRFPDGVQLSRRMWYVIAEFPLA